MTTYQSIFENSGISIASISVMCTNAEMVLIYADTSRKLDWLIHGRHAAIDVSPLGHWAS